MTWFGFSNTSITARLTMAFAVIVVFVATLYSVATVRTLELTETLLVAEFLEDDMTHHIERLDRGEAIGEQDNIRFYGSGTTPVPERYRHLPLGYTELVDPEPVFALHRRLSDGREFVMLRDQIAMETFERSLHVRVLLSLLVVLVAGLFVGWFISRMLTGPVKKLTRQVRAAAAAKRWQPLTIELANDEVGELARMVDLAMRRLEEALVREKQFTEDVSHELRTPLSVLQTSLELLGERELDEKARAHIERMQHAVHDMRDLMELFLNFARAGKGCDEVPLKNALSEVVRGCEQKAAQKGLTLTYETREVCQGLYPPVLVATVAHNLLRNAVSYTQSGSVTLVETAEGFEVRDTGCGIADEQKSRIFERYRRLDQTRRGAGVGLSLVKRICTHSRWSVAVSDNPGGGTVFAVRLRASPDETKPV